MPPYRKSYPFDPISPPQSGDFATPIVTLRLPQGIYTYVDGALENTLYDTRAWIGTNDQKEDAVEAIEQAMRIIREPMSITAIDVADCVLRVKYGADTEWTTIGDLTACATATITDATANTLAAGADATAEIVGTTLVIGVPQGIQGAMGADGENGVDGQDGQDGVDGQDGTDGRDGTTGGWTGETEKFITDDLDGHLCAIAAGSAAWISRTINTALAKAQELFETGKAIADQVTDLLDAFPVAGAIVNNIGDLFGAISTAGDWGDLIVEIGNPEFIEKVQCWLYCYMKDHTTDVVNIDMFHDAIYDVAGRAALLPPAAPFVTVYGQVYAAMLLSMSYQAIWLRAYIHADETSDDCLSLCTDCPPPVTCPTFTFDGTPNYDLVTSWGTEVSGGHSGDALGIVESKNDGDAIVLAWKFERNECEATGLTAWVYIDWHSEYYRTLQWWLYDASSLAAPIASGALESAIPPAMWTQVTIPFGVGALSATEYQLRFRTGAEGQNGTFKIDDVVLTE